MRLIDMVGALDVYREACREAGIAAPPPKRTSKLIASLINGGTMQQARVTRLLRQVMCLLILGSVSNCDGDGGSPTLAESLFLPANALTVEGNGSNSSPFENTAGRFQTVYGPALLGGLPNGARLTGMRFRLNENQSAFSSVTISNLEIRLSTSQRQPGSLSTTFATNRGADEVVVRTGPLAIAPADYAVGNTPNTFGRVITFNQPFTYRGGALLLEMAYTGLAPADARRTDSNSGGGDVQSGYGVANGFNSATADVGLFPGHIVVEYLFIRP